MGREQPLFPTWNKRCQESPARSLLAEQDGLENKLAQIKHVIRLKPLARAPGDCKPSQLEAGDLGKLNQCLDIENFLSALSCPCPVLPSWGRTTPEGFILSRRWSLVLHCHQPHRPGVPSLLPADPTSASEGGYVQYSRPMAAQLNS